jgi:membrane protein implicated in regulation of membrane protease activity
MKIPALVWLMLGLFLSVASWYLGDDFILFFYAGLVIITLGVFKIIISYILSPKETKKEKKRVRKREHPHYTRCRHCNNMIRKIDYFCSMCGRKLK